MTRILLTVGIALILIIVYKKFKKSEEELLGLKLIGYYILGGFHLNIDNLTLPLGFIIYIIFFKTKINYIAKKYAAILGLTVFIVGFFIPVLNEAYIERVRYVDISSTNAYELDFESDYQIIIDELNISKKLKIEDFHLDFEKNGNIKKLEYLLVERNNENFIIYRVDLDLINSRYRIKPTITNEWLQYTRLVNSDYFYKLINNLDFIDIIPLKEYPWYSITSEGEWGNQGITQYDNYIIENKSIRHLNKGELPIEGYALFIYGNEQKSKNSYSSTDKKFYIFK